MPKGINQNEKGLRKVREKDRNQRERERDRVRKRERERQGDKQIRKGEWLKN